MIEKSGGEGREKEREKQHTTILIAIIRFCNISGRPMVEIKVKIHGKICGLFFNIQISQFQMLEILI